MSDYSDIPAEFASIEKTDENVRYIRHLLGLSLRDFYTLLDSSTLEKRGGVFSQMRVILSRKYNTTYTERLIFDRYFVAIRDIPVPAVHDLMYDNRKIFSDMCHDIRRRDFLHALTAAGGQITEMGGYFLMYRVMGEKKTRYAFMYSKPSPALTDVYDGYAACVGHGVLSLDGEYRPMFFDEKHVANVIHGNTQIFDDLLKISVGVKFEQISFQPPDAAYRVITDGRIDINLYLIAIFVRYMERKLSLRDPTLADAEDRELLGGGVMAAIDKIAAEHTMGAMITAYEHIAMTGGRVRPMYRVGMGQKLVPLSVPDGRSVMNIALKSWREIYIHNELIGLFINFVAHAFPILYNWFILDDINDNMFGKYDSEHYAAILGDSIATDSKAVAPNLGPRFIEASKRTSVSGLLILLEHVGDPVKSMAYIGGSKYYRQHGPFLFAAHENVVAYLFTLVYTLLAMNTRLGLIHCDLHLNNVTVAQTAAAHRGRANLYHAYGKIYAPPVTNLDTYIIDFSRSLITSKMETVNFDAHNAETMNFYYRKLFPDERMEDQIEHNFAAVYNQFAAIDMYMHTTRLAAFMREHRREMKIPDESIKLVEAIRADTAEMLTTEARAAEPPNKRLLERHFAHLCIGPSEIKKITNMGVAYSIHGDLRYQHDDADIYVIPYGILKNFDDDSESAIVIPLDITFTLMTRKKIANRTLAKSIPKGA